MAQIRSSRFGNFFRSSFFIFPLKIRRKKKQITMETVQKEEGGGKDTGFPSSAS